MSLRKRWTDLGRLVSSIFSVSGDWRSRLALSGWKALRISVTTYIRHPFQCNRLLSVQRVPFSRGCQLVPWLCLKFRISAAAGTFPNPICLFGANGNNFIFTSRWWVKWDMHTAFWSGNLKWKDWFRDVSGDWIWNGILEKRVCQGLKGGWS
jgi:hypothetical protein